MDESKKGNKAVKKRRKTKIIKTCFKEYTENTSLHGLKYIGEQGNSIFERGLWVVSIVISIGICTFLIAKIWMKWESSPVIVSFAETAQSIWNIPFPAVTICPMQVISKSAYTYRGKCSENLTKSEIFTFQSIGLLCLSPYRCHRQNYTNDSLITVFKDVAMKMDDYIGFVQYNSKYLEDSMQPSLTVHGICHTFNMMNLKDIYEEDAVHYDNLNINNYTTEWKLDSGYESNSKENVYPHRGIAKGRGSGLFILLHRNRSEIEDECSGLYEGFRVYLHLPSSPIAFYGGYNWITFNVDGAITLEPQMVSTSDDLRKYDPKTRQCYFEDERKLKYFKIYTQENCEAECFANLTLISCGCTPFYLPRVNSTKICSGVKKLCVGRVEDTVQLPENLIKIREKNFQSCNCLPACTSLKYKPTVTQVPFNVSKSESLGQFFTEDVTTVSIHFESSQFIASKRSELYGIVDFLANCGGLLGVCLGFSILSLVEIIYFIVFRCLRYCKKGIESTQP